MKISAKQYAQSLYDLVVGKTAPEVKTVVKSFVTMLGNHRAWSQTAEIIKNFEAVWNQEQGELSAELTSARTLGHEAKDLVVAYLSHKTGAKKINLQEKVKPELIGGFILHYNSQIIDGSLRSSLDSLKSQISN